MVVNAKAELESKKLEKIYEQRILALQHQPSKYRDIWYMILSVEEVKDGKVKYRYFRALSTQQQEEAISPLDSFSIAEKEKFFELMFPKLGKYVAYMWNDMIALPFQGGIFRHSFIDSDPSSSLLIRSSRINLLAHLLEYDGDIVWYAEYAGYMQNNDVLGYLFASVITHDETLGKQIYSILEATAYGNHPFALMGRHVIRAFMSYDSPDAWEVIQKVLKAAERQEGLRQNILEIADEGYRGAFIRTIKTVIDEKLARFSATVRAVDTWLDLGWTAEKTTTVEKVIAEFYEYLTDQKKAEEMVWSQNYQSGYIALWSIGFMNLFKALELSRSLLDSKVPEQRFIAYKMLSMVRTEGAFRIFVNGIKDTDDRVLHYVIEKLPYSGWINNNEFPVLLDFAKRMVDKPKSLGTIVWSWQEVKFDPEKIYRRLLSVYYEFPSEDRLKELVQLFKHFDPHNRSHFLSRLSQKNPKVFEEPFMRDFLFEALLDKSNSVYNTAMREIEKLTLKNEEVSQVEQLLKRKTGSVRRGVLKLLLTLSDDKALLSAERLMKEKDANMRAGGIELAKTLIERNRAATKASALLSEYAGNEITVSVHETGDESDNDFVLPDEKPTLKNNLGLADVSHLYTPPEPKSHIQKGFFSSKNKFITDKVQNLFSDLDSLIDKYKNEIVTFKRFNDVEAQEVFGNVKYQFNSPRPGYRPDSSEFLLGEIWIEWYEKEFLTKYDPMDLLLASVAYSARSRYRMDYTIPWLEGALDTLYSKVSLDKLTYPLLISKIIDWLLYLYPPQGMFDFMLDATETAFSLVPKSELNKEYKESEWNTVSWRKDSYYLRYFDLVKQYYAAYPDTFSYEQVHRLWDLARWFDEPIKGMLRIKPDLSLYSAMYKHSVITVDELTDKLIGHNEAHGWRGVGWDTLAKLTRKNPDPLYEEFPIFKKIVPEIVQRLLAIELRRGDLPTEVSSGVMHIRSLIGSHYLQRFIGSLGKLSLSRGYRRGEDKADVFSHLIQVTFPAESDSAETVQKMADSLKLKTPDLLELAMFAPQWAALIEKTLGWKGLEEAVWWMHAHTKDHHWSIDGQIRERWEAEIQMRTTLKTSDLYDGAVDVEWFMNAYRIFTKDNWQALNKAAKYTSSGTGHARAELFARTMLGLVTEEEILERIKKSRNQEYVRALGLLPLQESSNKEQAIFDRYKFLQQFKKESRQFGSQRQNSEKHAISVAMINLAKNAGYKDPLRLTWAMESKEFKELGSSSWAFTHESTKVLMEISDSGKAEIVIEKDNKKLKTVPAALKTLPEYKEMIAAKKTIADQLRRIRASLENAMTSKDTFTIGEIKTITDHPLIENYFGRLVIVDTKGLLYKFSQKNKSFISVSGKEMTLLDTEIMRVAHAYDLYQSNKWSEWQQLFFDQKIIQPFKQLFRELYLVTEEEKKEGNFSRRYAGHQVQPKQALALLRTRGWVANPDSGVFKVFHDANLTVSIGFRGDLFTPSEVEGLTLEAVIFYNKDDGKVIKIEDVDPLLFSEIMRDIDLIVSVAHMGDIDPEASQSTVEMRATLVRETARLLQLQNVRIEKSHVFVTGKLAEYTVHLGSAITHVLPGGMLFVVPVHSQHRQIFLPFLDSDPKSAEVLSKVLLLAQDEKIKDPSIIHQIVR